MSFNFSDGISLFNRHYFVWLMIIVWGQVLPLSLLSAQSSKPEIRSGMMFLKNQKDAAASQLIRIGSVISPSGEEEERAEVVASEMHRIGLKFIEVDPLYNVVGILSGKTDSCLVLVSTLDDLASVAINQRALNHPLVQVGNRVQGPGSHTSSTTVAMLQAAEALIHLNIKPYYTLIFAGVSREEIGLDGMKKIYKDWKNRAVGFVDILGDGSTISYGAIGIHWWKVYAKGPEGHSLRGGTPNTNQGIGRAIDEILSIEIPEKWAERSTVLNVGMIRSGEVFNQKPREGWFSLDIRSLDMNKIEFLEDTVRHILRKITDETSIQLTMEPYQITPGGQIDDALQHPLVRTAIKVSEILGYTSSLTPSGSSNMNIPLADGKIAIGVSGQRGGERGYPEEWSDLNALVRSAQFIFLTCLLFPLENPN